MFTIKLHHTINDYWEVYNAARYIVETEHDESTGHGTRTLKLYNADNEVSLTTYISDMDDDWDAVYIVNDLGNTVDRVHPARAKASLLTCECCGETVNLIDAKGFCPDCAMLRDEATANA